MFEEDDDEMDGRFVVDEFEPLPRPMGDSPDYYIGFETEAERERRLEKEAELAEEEFFREEREYNAKQAAKHEFDPLIFDNIPYYYITKIPRQKGGFILYEYYIALMPAAPSCCNVFILIC